MDETTGGDKIMTNEEILELKINKFTTIKQYLRQLLQEVWIEGSMFNSKRPFGNSDWQFDVYVALVESGVIVGTFDKDGYLEACDTLEGDIVMHQLIFECFKS